MDESGASLQSQTIDREREREREREKAIAASS